MFIIYKFIQKNKLISLSNNSKIGYIVRSKNKMEEGVFYSTTTDIL